jgi:hypothetical protein
MPALAQARSMQMKENYRLAFEAMEQPKYVLLLKPREDVLPRRSQVEQGNCKAIAAAAAEVLDHADAGCGDCGV